MLCFAFGGRFSDFFTGRGKQGHSKYHCSGYKTFSVRNHKMATLRNKGFTSGNVLLSGEHLRNLTFP